ncbi:hypothetical protein [Streptomyces sp. NBC_01334]|nr:hypothetical protein OG736_43510 [Streptomyces sp. NBC_01334]
MGAGLLGGYDTDEQGTARRYWGKARFGSSVVDRCLPIVGLAEQLRKGI